MLYALIILVVVYELLVISVLKSFVVTSFFKFNPVVNGREKFFMATLLWLLFSSCKLVPASKEFIKSY